VKDQCEGQHEQLQTDVDMAIIKLLHAAGEKISEPPDMKRILRVKGIELKHLCQEAIRQHLLEVNCGVNLFFTVPQLPLPESCNSTGTPCPLPEIIQGYILLEQSLVEEEQEEDEETQ